MTEHERRRAAVEKLHRMIIYVREEAVRLRVMDVALLLDHAEEAVTAFSTPAPSRRDRVPSIADANRVEH